MKDLQRAPPLGQFDYFPRFRCLLGLRDAAHNTDCRNGRT